MAIIYVLLVISMMATVAPAAVKRDDGFQAGSSSATGSSSSTGSSGTSSPVYSPPAGSMGSTYSGSGSAISYSQSYNPGSLPSGSGVTSNQYSDHSAAGSSNNFQSSPSNQGNLYYYYYPVQDKPKDGGYQAAASQQYASAVTPNADGSSQHIDASAQNQASNPSDLSYSAQDLSYSAQAMNPGMTEYSGSAQASSNYDQTLSSLASQLQQQYGYATQGNNAPSYASASQQQPSFTQSYTYDPSQQQHQATQMEQAGQYSASNQIPNYGVAGQQAQFIPAQQAQQLAGFNPAAAQAAAQSMYAQYPGASGLHFGNFAAGSGPSSSFEPAASGYRRYGIGSFIMPMLALAGLSLLIPTVTSLTASGRKKRSIDGDLGAKDSVYGDYFDRMERYYSIYKTAVEKEECLNRIICELGDAMSGVKGKSTLFSDVSFKVLEKIVPTWMGNQVGVFKSAAQTSSEFGKCKKYTCQKEK